MQIADHFFDDVEMDVYKTLYFEPLGTIFPELRGARFVGRVLVN